MTKGAAPGHVCVSTALPDTMTRTHATWRRMLNKKKTTLLIFLFHSPGGQNTPCLRWFSSSWAMLSSTCCGTQAASVANISQLKLKHRLFLQISPTI